MRNPVLMIAFHFPPAAMGSGHLRTLGFARYLPELGWDPIVLSAGARAYPRTAPLDGGVIPSGCLVRRTLALDAGRHFAIAGKYPGFIAQPDRWASWWPAAVWQGLRLIRRYQVRAIWSTYPIMTTHCIARTLSRMTKLPWIADFRDPVISSVSAVNRFSAASQHRWEQRVLQDATRVVFATPGALRTYSERYPEACAEGRLAVIENGYDEATFVGLPKPAPRQERRQLVLLHSGLLYPEGRNPVPFLTAVAQLKDSGSVSADDLRVVLRASGSEAIYGREVQRLGLEELVTLAPPVSNREALIEQAEADALLLFQGSRFDRQIPAKLYEYLRIGRPIFALVGDQGDTAELLHSTGGAELAPLDDAYTIRARLLNFITALRENRAPQIQPGVIDRYSRRGGAVLLADLLHQVSTSTSGHARR